MRLISLHTPTPAAATTPISPVCPACGIVKRSGKLSCCAPGGSWFGNCGSAGNANLEHTWHEGIRVCNTQYHVVMGQHLHASQPKGNANMGMDSKLVIVTTHAFVSTSTNASMIVPVAALNTVLANNTPIITAARKALPYGANTTTSEAPTKSSTKIIHTSANISTSKLTISPVNVTIIKLMHSTLGNISMAPLSHTLASASVTRECEKLLNVLARVSTILIIAYV